MNVQFEGFEIVRICGRSKKGAAAQMQLVIYSSSGFPLMSNYYSETVENENLLRAIGRSVVGEYHEPA